MRQPLAAWGRPGRKLQSATTPSPASSLNAEAKRVVALNEAADEAQRSALASLRTEFVLALSAMTTLREARERLSVFALELARRRRVKFDETAVAYLAGRVLNVFLEPNCPLCDGRGFTKRGRHEHTARPT
jgi:hypothetical protein